MPKTTIPDRTGRLRRHGALAIFTFLSVVLILSGCAKDNTSTVAPEESEATALHHSTGGMEYWYAREQGGFETITGIPFDDLACSGCHVPVDGCLVCHETLEGDRPADARCTDVCHSRQAAEIALGIPDVHRTAGMGCADCHSANEVHGDGNRYDSMLSTGAMETTCTSSECHPQTGLPSNLFHSAHLGNMECAACHAQEVVTCYNCHFESEVVGDGKIAAGQFRDWKFLVQSTRSQKVALANVQTLTYEGKGFVAIAPFHAHTIVKQPFTQCGVCHNNAFVQEYDANGSMTAVTWSESENRFVQSQGIIPVPGDWESSLKFSFATLDDRGPPNWIEITPTEVGHQMLFAEPLHALPR